MAEPTPDGLGAGGRSLWTAITDEHELTSPQLVQLEEACRAKDRCDRLAVLLNEEHDHKLQSDANNTANLLKQLLAALRLPDPETGRRPGYRGARGAQVPSVAGGKVSSLDRARARKSGV